jgi:hypothetical protein
MNNMRKLTLGVTSQLRPCFVSGSILSAGAPVADGDCLHQR